MNWFRNATIEDSWHIWEKTMEPYLIKALHTPLNRPYWRRLWIVQEFALARRPLLLCGQSMISLAGSRGKARLKNIWRWEYWESPFPDGQSAAFSVLNTWIASREGMETPDLHQMMYELRDQECEKSKDRIFALLALYYERKSVCNYDKPIITADYKGTLERLFYRVLGECDLRTCLDEDKAESKLQRALNLPDCNAEHPENAYAFVEDVLELGCEARGGMKLDVTEMATWEDEYDVEIIVDEVIHHLEEMTGLSKWEMLRDPEGTYLEILGRLYHYDEEGYRTLFPTRGDKWEAFTNILRRTLGMPLINYAAR